MRSVDLFGNPENPHFLEESPTYTTPSFVLPTPETEGSVEDDAPPRSFPGIALILTLIVGVLATQCFRLQVTQGAAFRLQAEGNSIKILTLPSERGLIVDSTGQVLAQNSRQLALVVTPQSLPAKKSERQAVYTLLRDKAGIDQKTIDSLEDQRDSADPISIKTNLSKDDSLLYKEYFTPSSAPGVSVQESPIRQYTSIPSSGQIFGYVGQANTDQDKKNGYTPNQQVGKSGLEQQYDQLLQGIPGKQETEVDAYGQKVRDLPGSDAAQPKAGETLKLSIDDNLQKVVASALQEAVDKRNAIFKDKTKKLGASAVILNPNNGAILSMVSLPDYDANLFAGGISQKDYTALVNNPADPLLNRTIQGEYPSGSVVKPLVAAGALQNGVISANRTLDTSSSIVIGQSVFPDWKKHGISDVKLAIAQSNDIFFYALGGGLSSQKVKGLGIDNLNKTLEQFGLGSPVHVDLPGEASGLTPGPEWKQKNVGEPWYIGDTYHQSIGQGYLLVTPLQMATATAAIANGGTLYQPQLAWSTINPTTGKETLLPHNVLNSNWISPANIQTVQQGMEMSTQPGGTAQLLGKLDVPSAGKTGTAEFGTDGLTHSWYVGYAPVDHPQYAYAILVEGDGNVTEATEGSEPVAEEILRSIFKQPLEPGQQLFTQALVPNASTTP